MPLAIAPPRKTRFGGPLALSKVRWVRAELVAEITYLSGSEDGLLREASRRTGFGAKVSGDPVEGSLADANHEL